MLKNDVWDLFENFSKDLDLPTNFEHQFTPKIEVRDLDKTYLLTAEIPGMDEKDINVSLRNNQLIIEGEKKNETKTEDKKKGVYHSEFSYGRFYRAIPFSDDVDTDKVSASYKNGLLSIELGKRPEAEMKDRKIEIKSGGHDKKLEAKH